MNEEDDIFRGLGIEVSLQERDDFLKIKETLTRIGVSSRKEKKLILHFKELFELDGLESNVSDEDIARRNTIVDLLNQWGLLEIIDDEDSLEPKLSLAKLKIIPHKEKNDWELVPKYHIGKKK